VDGAKPGNFPTFSTYLMALPIFLKKAKEAGVSMPADPVVRKPDDGAEEYDPLHSAVEDLKSALDRGDTKAAAEAWRSGHEIISSSQTPDPTTSEG
jgi:hypothetical protein